MTLRPFPGPSFQGQVQSPSTMQMPWSTGFPTMARVAQQNPNSVTKVQPQAPGLATTQGVQAAMQKAGMMPGVLAPKAQATPISLAPKVQKPTVTVPTAPNTKGLGAGDVSSRRAAGTGGAEKLGALAASKSREQAKSDGVRGFGGAHKSGSVSGFGGGRLEAASGTSGGVSGRFESSRRSAAPARTDIQPNGVTSRGKHAAQDNSKPAVSATGESKGLSFADAGPTLYGRDAWDISKYARRDAGHSRKDITPFVAGKLGSDEKHKEEGSWMEALPEGDEVPELVSRLAGKEGADLTPFARGFFSRCASQGLGLPEIRAAVEQIGGTFGKEAQDELRDGLEKVAGVGDFIRPAWQGIKAVGPKLVQYGQKAFTKAAPLADDAAKAMGQGARAAAPVADDLAGAASRGSGAWNTTKNLYGRATASPVGQYAGSALQTAGGGFMGWHTAPDVTGDNSWGSHIGGALAGAGAANPWSRRFLNQSAGGRAALRGWQGSVGGSFGGSALDAGAGALGYDTQGAFGRAGARIGLGLGVGTSLAGKAGLGNIAGRNQFVKGLSEFGRGAMTADPVVGTVTGEYANMARRALGNPAVTASGARRAGQWFGAAAGGAGLGSTYLTHRVNQEAARIINDPATSNHIAQMAGFQDAAQMKQVGQTAQQLLGSGGIGALGQLGEPLMRIADSVLGFMGMNPAQMSGAQKLMMVLGGGMMLGGAIGGGAGLGGLGAATMLGGAALPAIFNQQLGAGGPATGQPDPRATAAQFAEQGPQTPNPAIPPPGQGQPTAAPRPNELELQRQQQAAGNQQMQQAANGPAALAS